MSFQVWRTGFFLSFPNEANVRAQWNVRSIECIERCQLRVDCSFVVAGGTGVDSLLTIHVLKQWAKWGILPFGESDRLSIVVSVENDRVGCPGNFLFAEDDRRYSRKGQQPCRDVALPQKFDQGACISIQIGRICRHVWNAQQ